MLHCLAGTSSFTLLSLFQRSRSWTFVYRACSRHSQIPSCYSFGLFYLHRQPELDTRLPTGMHRLCLLDSATGNRDELLSSMHKDVRHSCNGSCFQPSATASNTIVRKLSETLQQKRQIQPPSPMLADGHEAMTAEVRIFRRD